MAILRKQAATGPLKKPKPVTPPEAPGFLQDSELRTSLDADAKVSGKLSFNNPTRVDGKLKGELSCSKLLLIGASAVIEGTVRAEDLRVQGTVRGDIRKSGRVEILPEARVEGGVEAKTLVLHEGAFLEGRCRVGVE